MSIEILTPRLEQQYNDFLKSQKSSTIYYSLKYRDLISRETSSYPHYLVSKKNDKINGIFPLMIKDGPLGKIINSLPYFGSHGGIVATDTSVINEFITYYNELLSTNNYAASVIIENPFLKKIDYDQIKYNEIDQRVSQITDISGDYHELNDLLKLFHSKTRNSIRKAIKSNIEISINNKAWDFVYNTHLNNMKRLEGNAKKKSFFNLFKSIMKSEKDFNIYVAKLNSETIAALLIIYHGETVEYFTPVVKSEFRDLQPMSLIIAKAMMDASVRGFNCWNWGGTWLNQDGVNRFKSRWGTSNKLYNYYISIMNKEIYDASKEYLMKHYDGFYVIPFNKIKNK